METVKELETKVGVWAPLHFLANAIDFKCKLDSMANNLINHSMKDDGLKRFLDNRSTSDNGRQEKTLCHAPNDHTHEETYEDCGY